MILCPSEPFCPLKASIRVVRQEMTMKREYHATARAIAAEAGTWLLTTGLLVIAALVTLAPFILL